MHNIYFQFIRFSIFFMAVLCSCTEPNKKIEKELLWYEQPAKNWNEALPLGNGKLGVMVFGDPINERIQLNDDSMWPADMEDWDLPDGNKNDLTTLRNLLFEGKNEIADSLFVAKMTLAIFSAVGLSCMT